MTITKETEDFLVAKPRIKVVLQNFFLFLIKAAIPFTVTF